MKKFIITCEHSGSRIPGEYQKYFKNYSGLLSTHHGFDIGISGVFEIFIETFNFTAYSTDVSRLLIDTNRSPGSRNLYSSVTKTFGKKIKEDIYNEYYLPYRNAAENKMKKFLNKGAEVIHISFHSFTPGREGKMRNADIGLLYDPASVSEKNFCFNWRKEILKIDHTLKVRFNYPYLGISDGFTSYLRKKFRYEKYTGIELEINQKLLSDKETKNKITSVLIDSFRNI